MHGFIEFWLWLETLNILKQIDWLYINSLSFCFLNFEPVAIQVIKFFSVSRNPSIIWERKYIIFVYLYCTASKENEESIRKNQ